MGWGGGCLLWNLEQSKDIILNTSTSELIVVTTGTTLSYLYSPVVRHRKMLTKARES